MAVKKSLIICAVLLIVSELPAAERWKEPDGFMGLKFGRPISDGTMPECPLNKTETEAAKSRQQVLDSIRARRESPERLIASREEDRRRLAEEYARRRELYHQGQISREEVQQAERELVQGMLRVDEAKQLMTEAEKPTGQSHGEFKHYDEIKARESGKPCWQQLGRAANTHKITNVAMGGFIVDVNAESLDGKLAHVFIVFRQGAYGQIFLTFRERYGAPTSVRTETVQSRIGAKFNNEIVKWESPRLTITLKKFGSTVDKGTISYDTDTWRIHAAKKFQQEIKKAAKKL